VTSYYDLGAANDRIGELRPLLHALRDDRDAIAAAQLRLQRLERTVRQIDAWGITLRDIGMGLVDFPALANGRPIWLCWKLGEDDVTFWHELEAGIAGRKPLIELE
jgi:hypothetical protein